jgi:hypothetical protein
MGTYFDAYGNPTKPKSAGVVLPLLLALLASGGANYWLWKDRAKTTEAAFAATAKLVATEAVQKEMAEKLEKQEAERAALVEAKDQAIKDAQARALELAKLKDDVAGVEVTKEPGPETAADGKAKPDVNAKADKKADAKAEVKPKAIAKPKKKAAVHKSKAKKDSDASEPPAREL